MKTQHSFRDLDRRHVFLMADPTKRDLKSMGFGLHVTGGVLGEDGRTHCLVTSVDPEGNAKQHADIAAGDEILEWNGQCLMGCTYEEVLQLMRNSGSMLRLLVRHQAGRKSERRCRSEPKTSISARELPMCPKEEEEEGESRAQLMLLYCQRKEQLQVCADFLQLRNKNFTRSAALIFIHSSRYSQTSVSNIRPLHEICTFSSL